MCTTNVWVLRNFVSKVQKLSDSGWPWVHEGYPGQPPRQLLREIRVYKPIELAAGSVLWLSKRGTGSALHPRPSSQDWELGNQVSVLTRLSTRWSSNGHCQCLPPLCHTGFNGEHEGLVILQLKKKNCKSPYSSRQL